MMLLIFFYSIAVKSWGPAGPPQEGHRRTPQRESEGLVVYWSQEFQGATDHANNYLKITSIYIRKMFRI